MAEPIQIGSFTPTEDTRLGRMLAGGRLTASMRSKRSGEHVTLTLHAMAKKDKWNHVPFAEATHVFIKMGHGEYGSGKIGTYYPKTGKLYLDTQDAAWRYAAIHTLGAAHHGMQDTDKHEVFEESLCGVCGRELTDPVSIERGIGPTCLGAMTGSKHYHARTVTQRPSSVPGNRPVTVERTESAVVMHGGTNYDKKGRNVPRTFEALAAAVRG